MNNIKMIIHPDNSIEPVKEYTQYDLDYGNYKLYSMKISDLYYLSSIEYPYNLNNLKGKYLHSKTGNTYTVNGLSFDTSSNDDEVWNNIYVNYTSDSTGINWFRNFFEFFEGVKLDINNTKPRFKKVQ